jgi:hypothetical protein
MATCNQKIPGLFRIQCFQGFIITDSFSYSSYSAVEMCAACGYEGEDKERIRMEFSLLKVYLSPVQLNTLVSLYTALGVIHEEKKI